MLKRLPPRLYNLVFALGWDTENFKWVLKVRAKQQLFLPVRRSMEEFLSSISNWVTVVYFRSAVLETRRMILQDWKLELNQEHLHKLFISATLK